MITKLAKVTHEMLLHLNSRYFKLFGGEKIGEKFTGKIRLITHSCPINLPVKIAC